MSDFLGFSFIVILNLYGITFHPVVVLEPEHDFLFKSTSTYCDALSTELLGQTREWVRGVELLWGNCTVFPVPVQGTVTDGT